MLFVLSIQLSGYHLYYAYNRWNLKATMKARLQHGSARSRLRAFRVLPASERDRAKWLKEHEFSYHGEMYDVVERKESGDQIILYCINDREESALNMQYEKMTKNDFGKKPDGKNIKLLKLAASLYVHQAAIFELSVHPQEARHYARACASLADNVPGILKPPPRRA